MRYGQGDGASGRVRSADGLGLDQSASRDLAFVSCEGGEDFFLLASRHFDEVQRAAEFRRDLVKFLWRDSEVPMRLLETDRSFSGPGRRVWERPAGDGTNPKRSHELEARQPVEPLSMPLPQGWVLRRFPHNRVVHDRVAEVIHHRCDGEDAAEALIQTLLNHLHQLPWWRALYRCVLLRRDLMDRAVSALFRIEHEQQPSPCPRVAVVRICAHDG
jgi:hypothetical protein